MQLNSLPCAGQTSESPMPEAEKGSRRGKRTLLTWDLSCSSRALAVATFFYPPNYPFRPLAQLRKFWDVLPEKTSLQPHCLGALPQLPMD